MSITLPQIKSELKVVLENVACLGSRDPKATEYQEKMINHIMILVEAKLKVAEDILQYLRNDDVLRDRSHVWVILNNWEKSR